MEHNIDVVSTSTVRAIACDSPPQRVELTPWDLQLLPVGPIQRGLLFPKPNTISFIAHLKTSLSRTLHFFPPLAGRLSKIDNHHDGTASFFIDCNNSGAQFVHAAADSISIADLIDSLYVPPVVHSFFPLNGIPNHQGLSQPLLAVQVTELADGLFIGCTVNHVVADGNSFWHFFNSWSEISRGSDAISKPPYLRRGFSDSPVLIPAELVQAFHGNKVTPPPVRERIFHFPKERIAQLKVKANSEIGAGAGGGQISSLQALLAHLWRSVVRNRGFEADEEVNFGLLIGARPRLKEPPLPEYYFGNTVQAGKVSMTAGELLEHGVGHAAWKLNKIVAMHTEEKFKSFLKSWAENPSFIRMLVGNALATSSSPRFNVYGNDFGWGKPISVRSGGANKSDGKITAFPGPEEGSIDIQACLPLEILQRIGEDVEFMNVDVT